jgi:hypothetical protein
MDIDCRDIEVTTHENGGLKINFKKPLNMPLDKAKSSEKPKSTRRNKELKQSRSVADFSVSVGTKKSQGNQLKSKGLMNALKPSKSTTLDKIPIALKKLSKS